MPGLTWIHERPLNTESHVSMECDSLYYFSLPHDVLCSFHVFLFNQVVVIGFCFLHLKVTLDDLAVFYSLSHENKSLCEFFKYPAIQHTHEFVVTVKTTEKCHQMPKKILGDHKAKWSYAGVEPKSVNCCISAPWAPGQLGECAYKDRCTSKQIRNI